MSEQKKIIDLLKWVNKRFSKRQPMVNDRWLNPITLQIEANRNYNNLWIPNVEGLRALGVELAEVDLQGLKLLEVNGLFGAGVGDEEATLSVLNQVRKYAA